MKLKELSPNAEGLSQELASRILGGESTILPTLTVTPTSKQNDGDDSETIDDGGITPIPDPIPSPYPDVPNID
jgi:hypothetical protein